MATWSSSRMMTDDWLCRPWSEDSRFRLIHSLSVLWLEYMFYQSHAFLSLLVMRHTSLTFCMIYQCVCSYALIFSKGCRDKPLTSSSSEWVYSQEGHHSLCNCDADSFLLVQAHLAHYAWGWRREEHESVFWVFNHSNLSLGRDRYFRLWAQITDSRSSWHSDPHEVEYAVAAWGSRWCSSASTSSSTSSCIIITGCASYIWYRSCIYSAYDIYGSSLAWS